jgi:predicted nucleotidyltransferase
MINDTKKLNDILSKVNNTANLLYEDRLSAVILFGSYARGDFNMDSDIDVMIIVDLDEQLLLSNTDEIANLMVDVTIEYGVTLSIILQSISKFEELKPFSKFYQNVEKEGVKYVA